MRDGADEIGPEFAADFIGELADFILQDAVAELEVVIFYEVLDAADSEGDADGDADGADGKNFDGAFDADGAMRTDAFQRRQADHLRLVKEEVARAALAGVHGKLRDGLAQQFAERLAGHVVRHVKSIDINHFADILAHLVRGGFKLGGFGCFRG